MSHGMYTRMPGARTQRQPWERASDRKGSTAHCSRPCRASQHDYTTPPPHLVWREGGVVNDALDAARHALGHVVLVVLGQPLHKGGLAQQPLQ